MIEDRTADGADEIDRGVSDDARCLDDLITGSLESDAETAPAAGTAWSATTATGTPRPGGPPGPDPATREAPPLFWARRLRQIRSCLTPLRDLGRLARTGAVNLLTPGIAHLIAALHSGVGVDLCLPP